MASFESSMEILLEGLYRDLEQLEGHMLSASTLNLSISEIHLLEAVEAIGAGQGATISELSDKLGISLPSVTMAVNKLEAKAFVTRQRSPADGRVVQVLLTRKGRKAERAHRYFHRSMVREIAAELSEAEKETIIAGVIKLDKFLKNNIHKYNNK